MEVNSTDLVGISQPATVLIEKCSDAVGGLFAPWQIRRLAKAEGKAIEILAQSEANAEVTRAQGHIKAATLSERAKRRSEIEEATHQSNMEMTLARAILHLDDDSAAPEKMEKDWISNFFDKARIVSDDDMQVLWAKILAGEANAPGTFSRKTVNVMADLGKDDAEGFAELCRFVMHVGRKTALIVYDCRDEIYTQNNIDADTLIRLNELDLITDGTSVFLPALTGFSSKVAAIYGDVRYGLRLPKESDNRLRIGEWSFTRTGRELSTLVESQPVEGFARYLFDKWSADEQVLSVKNLDDMTDVLPARKTTGEAIVEMFDRIEAKYPESTWDNVPSDGAINYKHYLYGSPKVDTK